MRIIVINLDEDTERRERIERRMYEFGLGWERLTAVLGSRLGPSHEALVDRTAHAARGSRFSPGEIGCWLSHRMAQQMVAEGSDEMALILEDDLRIHDDLPEVLDRLERGTAGRFDIIACIASSCKENTCRSASSMRLARSGSCGPPTPGPRPTSCPAKPRDLSSRESRGWSISRTTRSISPGPMDSWCVPSILPWSFTTTGDNLRSVPVPGRAPSLRLLHTSSDGSGTSWRGSAGVGSTSIGCCE